MREEVVRGLVPHLRVSFARDATILYPRSRVPWQRSTSSSAAWSAVARRLRKPIPTARSDRASSFRSARCRPAATTKIFHTLEDTECLLLPGIGSWRCGAFAGVRALLHAGDHRDAAPVAGSLYSQYRQRAAEQQT
ncbi:MAG: hypothetical protein U1F54_15475 [Burkholderiales bacterium]